MSGQELLLEDLSDDEEEYDTPEKRENALKKLIIDAIMALRHLHDVSMLLVDRETSTLIQRYIYTLRQQYLQITGERVDDDRPDPLAGSGVPAEPDRDMYHGRGRRRIHKSSVQRRKHHHSNKKGKTVRRKMTRTRRSSRR